MKKTLLLAGVACLFSFGANAADYSLSELRPYVGLDYVYTDANIKKETRIKTDYNSGAINAGIRFYDYLGLEAFFQQSGERKSMKGTLDQTKSEFYAYGLDLYGYMPIGCDGFNLVGSLGIANYNVKLKYRGHQGSDDKQRLGYRAGAGIQYDFNDNISARVMYRYTQLGMKEVKNLNEVNAGLRYSF